MVNGTNIGKYSGQFQVMTDSGGTGYVKFLTSGTFTPARALSVGVFLVGGGANGSNGYYGTANGGAGGAGGKTYTGTASLSSGTGYSIVVGATNTASTAFNLSSASGTSKAGGTGAVCKCTASTSWVESTATKGTNGVYAFSNSTIDGIMYGGGGGGGGCWNCNVSSAGASGGASGGGSGGAYDGSGVNGANNTGGGGGGRGTHNWYDSESNGGTYGTGGTGTVIIKIN